MISPDTLGLIQIATRIDFLRSFLEKRVLSVFRRRSLVLQSSYTKVNIPSYSNKENINIKKPEVSSRR